jgi:hypothetical protein
MHYSLDGWIGFVTKMILIGPLQLQDFVSTDRGRGKTFLCLVLSGEPGTPPVRASGLAGILSIFLKKRFIDKIFHSFMLK